MKKFVSKILKRIRIYAYSDHQSELLTNTQSSEISLIFEKLAILNEQNNANGKIEHSICETFFGLVNDSQKMKEFATSVAMIKSDNRIHEKPAPEHSATGSTDSTTPELETVKVQSKLKVGSLNSMFSSNNGSQS